jgi:hypothetical protein
MSWIVDTGMNDLGVPGGCFYDMIMDKEKESN